MSDAKSPISAIVTVVVYAVVMVVMGLVFFLVNLWIIHFAAELLKLSPDASFVVLSAALLSAASMLGSKGKK